jgi:hypothetical protein
MQDQHPPLYYVLQSRKFWATTIGLVLLIATAIINHQAIDPNALVNGIMILVSVYVGAIAVEDGLTNRNATTTTVSTPSSNVQVSTSDAPPPVTPVVVGDLSGRTAAPQPTKPPVGLTGLQ